MAKKRVVYGRSPSDQEINQFLDTVFDICCGEGHGDDSDRKNKLRSYLEKRVAKLWQHKDDVANADESHCNSILSLNLD